ncbi:RNA methyltransferase [Salinirubellus sp. GCM10025818]|uniref:RNA methyltransferase n=1 Tax=Salinirubellus TaxID=2162630 RepID=UPI0030CD5C7F
MPRSALVPSSLAREAEDKREATRKLGYVARAAAVFRLDRLVVFPDSAGEDGRFGDGFVATVLAYAATPPYLRKEAWGVRDELESVGVLPPLRVSPRTGSGSEGSGSLRQGIVTEVGPDGRVRVNCGMQHPVSLPVPPSMAVGEGERVTIRVSSERPLRAKLVDEPPPGFVVERGGLDAQLRRADAGLRVAASRFGTPLTVSRLDSTVESVDAAGGFTVVFGSPERGLPEILDVDAAAVGGTDATREANDAEPRGAGEDSDTHEPDGARFDLWLNTVPNQGSEVVRTEEAMFTTLAPLTMER